MRFNVNAFLRHRRELLLGAAVVLAAVGFLGWSALDRWEEARLLSRYRADPERRRFVEQLEQDRRDLAANPDATRRKSIVMDQGLQWYVLGEYERAIRYWQRGLKLWSDNDIGWYNLGNAYLKLKRYAEAEAAYQTSAAVAAPGEIDACLALGAMYRHDYTEKQAEEPKVYEECLKKHQDNWDILARLAVYYRERGDLKRAIGYYDKLFTLEPGNTQVGEELRDLRLKLEAAEQAAGKQQP